MSSQSAQQYSDFIIPGENIQSFAEMDLVELQDLPNNLEDLFALHIRIDAAFRSLIPPLRELIAENGEEIPLEVIHAVSAELALDFMERYGVLALLSTTLLRVLWEAQRPPSVNGPECLRQVGQRLAIFAMANKSASTKKSIDISFKFCKRPFMDELERLSRETRDFGLRRSFGRSDASGRSDAAVGKNWRKPDAETQSSLTGTVFAVSRHESGPQ